MSGKGRVMVGKVMSGSPRVPKGGEEEEEEEKKNPWVNDSWRLTALALVLLPVLGICWVHKGFLGMDGWVKIMVIMGMTEEGGGRRRRRRRREIIMGGHSWGI